MKEGVLIVIVTIALCVLLFYATIKLKSIEFRSYDLVSHY